MQRLLLIVGTLVIVAGLAWPWLAKLPWGRLPGDIVVDRPGFKFFFPFMTLIIVSVVVSVVLHFFRK